MKEKKASANYDVNSEPIVLSKVTSDILLKQEKPADVLALYVFYYITAKWQDQKNARCTTGYTANGLNWTEVKVRQTKKILLKLGLIEDVIKKDLSGKILGHYVRIHFKWTKDISDHPNEIVQGGFDDSVGNRKANTPYTNKEIQLKENKRNTTKLLFVVPANFDKFWKMYPKRNGNSKAKALQAWLKVCELPINSSKVSRPKWKEIKKAIKSQAQSERWQKQPEYIPLTSTWLNGYRWLDDAKTINIVQNYNTPKRNNSVGYHSDDFKLTKKAIKM